MKKIAVLAVFVFILAASGIASAGHGRGHEISLEDSCYKELVLLLMNYKDLGLTDEQVQTLKDKKYEIRRQDIQLDSQLALIALDIKKQLTSDTPNQAQLEVLIDNKVELKRTLNKAFAKAITDARTLLTPEQRAKFKDLLWNQWRGGACPFQSKGHHHPKG